MPSEQPDDIVNQLEQSRGIHGVRMNAGLRPMFPPLAYVQQDQWNLIDYTDNGSSDQTNIPRQMMSSGFMFGTRDRVQSMARQNQYGYDSKHMRRRYADAAGIPGNYMWMEPGGRPIVKHTAGTAQLPVGPGSPFYGNDPGAAFSTHGAVLANTPEEYQPPPAPQLAPPGTNGGGYEATTEVEWY